MIRGLSIIARRSYPLQGSDLRSVLSSVLPRLSTCPAVSGIAVDSHWTETSV